MANVWTIKVVSELIERRIVYERVLFAPRASAPWIRGRELGFETWERTNTDIYKHGICPKIYTAGFFRLKKCTRSIPPNLNSFSGKNTKMRENGETYTAGKSFTLDRMDIFANKFAQSSTTYS